MKEWLKEDKAASWEGLCKALESMGNEAEAQVIKEKYFSTQCTDTRSDEGIHIHTWLSSKHYLGGRGLTV